MKKLVLSGKRIVTGAGSLAYQLIETDRDDPMLTNNCIALEPGKVLFSAKGVRTRNNLEKAGVETIPIDISEINKLGGGIHCSTLPLLRDSI